MIGSGYFETDLGPGELSGGWILNYLCRVE